jgi:hypothetical protein
MLTSAREFLRRKLSPRAFDRLRRYAWLSSYYLPRLVASVFVRRAPMVQCFPGGPISEPFSRQLRGINVVAPTKMCRVMTRYGSDKGQGKHNFTTIYSVLFGTLRD